MKIFISYARTNRGQADALRETMNRAGHAAWYDKEISGGEVWWRSIINSIKTCDVFVFALSPESTESEACRAELQFAIELKKPILPIILKTAEMPAGTLQETQYVDGRDLRNPDTILELTRALTHLNERINSGGFPEPDPYPEDPVFPFPPDPLSDIREKLAEPTRLAEEELIKIIYRIQQVSHSSERTSIEAKKLLEKIATNGSLPYGVVELAKAAQASLPEKKRRVRSIVSAVILFIFVIGILGIALLYLNNNGHFFTSPGDVSPTMIETQVEVAQDDTATPLATRTYTPTRQATITDTATVTKTATATKTATVTKTATATKTATVTQTHTPSNRSTDTATPGTLSPANALRTEVALTRTAEVTLEALTRAAKATERAAEALTRTAAAFTETPSPTPTDTPVPSPLPSIGIANAPHIAQIGEPLVGHNSTVRTLAFSPDGKLLASGSSDFTVRVWDANTYEMVWRIGDAHTDWVNDVVFSPDSKLLVTVSHDKTAQIWDVETQKQLYKLERIPILAVDFSPDGNLIAFGLSDGTIELWDLQTETTWTTLTGHEQSVQAVDFSHDGSLLVSGSQDGTIRIWDIASTLELRLLQLARDPEINVVKFSPDDLYVASGSSSGVARVWDWTAGQRLTAFAGYEVWDLAFSRDGKLLAIATNGTAAVLWDWENDLTIANLYGHTTSIRSIAISPDGTVIATGGQEGDNTIRIWHYVD